MDGLTVPPALPAEVPLAMPVQSLRSRPARRRLTVPATVTFRRALVLGGAIALTAYATDQMVRVLGTNGMTALAWFIVALFVSLFAWIALALTSAAAGFVALLAARAEPQAPAPLRTRTALLMPIYNEDPARIMAALEAMLAELAARGVADRFDAFILSDTRDPDAWIAEEAAWLRLRARAAAPVFYRRRRHNTERKAGNIADWVRRWGGAYDHFLILDADSVMTGAALHRLVLAMEADEGAGLIQTLPVIVAGRTLFARLQQFAGRLYGPLIAHGIAAWHGAEGNYWGHNAIIRTRAFADAAGLPTLRGRKPFGGHVLSHDFVEAALLRRAGWAVRMLPALPGSYEEGPPSLADIAVRDRRWCQGNLQHAAVLPARGLHPVSRLHLLMGIGAYVTAPLWLLFLLTGILLSLEARFVIPDYFPAAPSLFPRWPVVDPVRSRDLFLFTMAVLFGPKLLATLAGLLRGEERRAFGGGLRLLAGAVLETVVSGLIAPVSMLSQSGAVLSVLSGSDGGWNPQRREDGRVPLAAIARRYARHTLAGLVLGLAAALVSLPLFLWMVPVTIGLALAIPLAAWTGGRRPAAALARAGLLRTPEDRNPPPILLAVAGLAACYAAPPAAALDRLLADPALLAAHRAMLVPRQPGDYDPVLLVARAKLDDSATRAEVHTLLTRPELAAALADPATTDRLLALTP